MRRALLAVFYGTVVRVRLDKKVTSISLLVALGVREDGQKVLLAVKNIGGEGEAAWRALLDDLVKRGLKTELVIVDDAPGLDAAPDTKLLTLPPEADPSLASTGNSTAR